MTLTGRRPPSARSAPTAAARAVEVAEAAALATLVVAVAVIDRIVPLGFAGFLLSAFPLAVLGVRHRLRVGVGGVVTATVLVFLGAGPGLAGKAFAATAVGFVVGVGLRRDWSTPRIALVATLVPTAPAAALATAALAALPRSRELILAQVLDGARGSARLLTAAGAQEAVTRPMVTLAVLTVEHWYVVIPAIALVSGFAGAALTTSLFRRPLALVCDGLPPVPHDLGALLGDRARVAPLPLRLRGVGVHRGGRRVVSEVDLDLDAGTLLTVTGPNGAGKSTLARVVAGLAPDEGAVERPGAAGLGAPGGTAMVFQRPESQVLGVRVGDDVRWGADGPVDVAGLLARVGLDPDAERETDTLSGGELQRLALAAALARRPAVVVSDETTAMLDEPGRAAVVALLGELAHAGTAIVHVTHRPAEIDAAGDRLALPAPPAPDPATAAAPGGHTALVTPRAGAAISLRGVAVTHDAGTPWRRDVLTGVDLDVPAGHTLLVTGANGAGKTTLAWVLAGLAAPSRGEAMLDGAPLTNGRGGALLAVQHARLALLRTTVGDDVRDAAGTDAAGADAALAAVGLDPDRFRDREVDALSGGEARRALLAGLLATDARVLVLDEPLAGLDREAVDAVTATLAAVRAAGTTLVITTHDVAPLAGLADAVVTVADGTVGALSPGGAAPRAPVDGPAPAVAAPDPRGRPPRRPVRRVGRTLPGASAMTRLRAGTKLGVLVAGVLALAVVPAWSTVGAALVVLAGATWAGRVPPGAWPRPPLPLLGVVGLWLVVASLGGEPDTTVAGVPVSLASAERTVLLVACALLTLAGSVLVVATTPVGSLPPLLRGLAARLRFTRLPVDEWAVTVALGLRLAPTLAEQARTVRLVLGQRRRARAPARRSLRERRRDAESAVVGVATLVCATALRRAAETADALVARGGVAGLPAAGPRRVTPADVIGALVAIAVLAAGAVVGVMLG